VIRTALLLSLGLLFGCAVPLGPDPATDVDLGPWPADLVTSLAVVATSGQVVLDGSAHRGELRLGATAEVESTTLDAGVLTLVAGGDLALSVPADLEWAITTTTGAVSVAGMAGSGHVATASGEVAGSGLGGDLSVQVEEAASVGLHLVSLPAGGMVIVESMVGPISLDLPADTSAALTASTGSGAVDISGVDYSGVLLPNSANGVLADGDGSIRLVTGAGAISVNGYGL